MPARMNAQTRYLPGSRRYRLDLALSQELRDAERIVWRGEELGSLELAPFAIYIFAVPWTAFSLLWTSMAATAVVSGGHGGTEGGILAWAFPLFGTPFIAAGIGMMAVPFAPWWNRGKVVYAITSERVIKVRLGRVLDVETCPKERIGATQRKEHSSGRGRLKLAVAIGRDSDGDPKTEYFVLGPVADIRGAQNALDRMIGKGSASFQS